MGDPGRSRVLIGPRPARLIVVRRGAVVLQPGKQITERIGLERVSLAAAQAHVETDASAIPECSRGKRGGVLQHEYLRVVQPVRRGAVISEMKIRHRRSTDA